MYTKSYYEDLEYWARQYSEATEEALYISFFDREPEYMIIDTAHHLAMTTERNETARALQEVFDWVNTATELEGRYNSEVMMHFSELFNSIMHNVEELYPGTYKREGYKFFSAKDGKNLYTAPESLPDLVRKLAEKLAGETYANPDYDAPFPWTEIAELQESLVWELNPVSQKVEYTYNYEGDLNADIQYMVFDDGGGSMFALVQVHRGGDTRGNLGYPVAVEVLDESFQDFNINWSCQNCNKFYDLTYDFIEDNPSWVLAEDVEFDEYGSADVPIDKVVFYCPVCNKRIWPYHVAEVGF